VNGARSRLFSSACNIPGACRVYRARELAPVFCVIHGRVRGSVDHYVRPMAPHSVIYSGRICYVALSASESNDFDIAGRSFQKLDSELPGGTGDKGPHYSLRI
jgi:hypothetical protein